MEKGERGSEGESAEPICVGRENASRRRALRISSAGAPIPVPFPKMCGQVVNATQGVRFGLWFTSSQEALWMSGKTSFSWVGHVHQCW